MYCFIHNTGRYPGIFISKKHQYTFFFIKIIHNCSFSSANHALVFHTPVTGCITSDNRYIVINLKANMYILLDDINFFPLRSTMNVYGARHFFISRFIDKTYRDYIWSAM